MRWLGVVLYALGGALRLWPVFVLGRLQRAVAIQPGHSLVTDGMYGTIRHPSYLGLLVLAVGWALALRSGVGLLLAALSVPPLLARIRSEEALCAPSSGGVRRLARPRLADDPRPLLMPRRDARNAGRTSRAPRRARHRDPHRAPPAGVHRRREPGVARRLAGRAQQEPVPAAGEGRRRAVPAGGAGGEPQGLGQRPRAGRRRRPGGDGAGRGVARRARRGAGVGDALRPGQRGARRGADGGRRRLAARPRMGAFPSAGEQHDHRDPPRGPAALPGGLGHRPEPLELPGAPPDGPPAAAAGACLAAANAHLSHRS